MKEPKKIALCIYKLCGGGAERFCVNLANSLSQNNRYQVYLLTGAKEDLEYNISNQVNRIEIFFSYNFFRNSILLRKFLLKNQIDALIAVDIYANLCASIINVLLKTKVIISERNAPKQVKISKKSKILRKLLYWRADYCVFQTEGAQKCYSKYIQKKSIVIPNPVKDNLPYRSLIPNKEIIAIGRLMHQKNYYILINAFNKLSTADDNYHLRIFGEGKEEEQLKKLVIDLNLEKRIHFEGFQLNVHELIKKSDIYVLTSDYEGLPNALMEAMAMGFPVIATDCPPGGPRSLIQDMTNGILIPMRNTDALENALLRLIKDVEFKETLAGRAVEVRNTYSIDNITNIWINFLESLLSK